MTTPAASDGPADAFAALSDSNRVAILEALWEADGHEASFSDLRSAVGMRDSGQFNYHLGKLTDQFVRQTDDGTYALSVAGIHVVGSIIGGTYTGETTVEARPADESCPWCGMAAVFAYEDEQFSIECPECDLAMAEMPAPAGVFEPYSPADAPAVGRAYTRNVIHDLFDGFCPFCRGPVEVTVTTYDPAEDPPVDSDTDTRTDDAGSDSDHPPSDEEHTSTANEDDDATEPSGPPTGAELRETPKAEYECERCGESIHTSLGALSEHPAAVAFYYDHGRNVADLPLGERAAVTPETAWVEKRDPLRAVVRFTADDEALELTVDDNLDVRDTTRTQL